MSSKILINALDSAECRIAKVQGGRLAEFHSETAAREITQGNIYKAIITRIEPSLQAVFVDYGAERNGFLQQHEIHSDYHHECPSGDRSLKNLVRRGQELLVQVTKDPIQNKGAMLTTYLSLAGRSLVLMPGSVTHGISRKIEDDEERTRLKEVLAGLKIPEGYGVIIRTAGESGTKTLITRDLAYLMRLWKKIKDSVMSVQAPALLYKERNLVVRSIRDYFTPEVDEILSDDPAVHHEVRDFIQIISPKHLQIVRLHKGDEPIFSKYRLEEQIASIFEKRVELTSGGSIVIEPTEAMVTIDVNSGKATQKKSVEETALQTNLEAAEEIARQLRLRDLGGLIVVDFIDMREAKHKAEVEKALKNHLKTDKAKTQVGKISRFGLLELSRQRLRPSIEFGAYETCRACRGKGKTPSVSTMGLAFLRKLSLETLRGTPTRAVGTVPVEVAEFLLNRKRRELLEIENRRSISIQIEGDPRMVPGECHLACE
jgi:ribonuclease E